MTVEEMLMTTVDLSLDDLIDFVIASQGLQDVDRKRCRVEQVKEGPERKMHGRSFKAFSGVKVVIVSKFDPPDKKPKRGRR